MDGLGPAGGWRPYRPATSHQSRAGSGRERRLEELLELKLLDCCKEKLKRAVVKRTKQCSDQGVTESISMTDQCVPEDISVISIFKRTVL